MAILQRQAASILTDSESFKSTKKIIGNIPADGNTKNAEIAVPSKHLGNFWRTLEIPLINCKVNLIQTWSKNCVISEIYSVTIVAIIDRKLYDPVASLSTQDKTNSLQQLNSGFKHKINLNKYQ